MLQRAPEHPAKSRTPITARRWLVVLFFALFPVAFLAGIALDMRNEQRVVYSSMTATGDRAGAIAAARRFLESQGVDTNHWRALCAALINEDLYRDLETRSRQQGAQIIELAPPVIVKVMFRSPDDAHYATVSLSTDNRVLGFDLHAIAAPSSSAAPASDSLAAAQSLISHDPQLTSIFGTTRPEVMTGNQSAAGVARNYTWRSPFPGMPEVQAQFGATLRDGRVLSRSMTATVDKAYVAHLQRNATILQIFGWLYLCFLSAAAFYSIYRYVRRAIEKEVSHSRTAWMAVLTAALFCCVLMNPRDDMVLQQANLDNAFPMAFVLVLLTLICAGGGILVGIGYGSGEGDVREAYPGKLTSIDALVLGKIFSSNVGRSVVTGSAFAGWLLFAQGLLLSPLSAEQSGHSLTASKFPYMVAPWLSFLAIQPAIVIVFSVAGLLQPLAFLDRIRARPKLRMALLIVFATFALSGTATAYTSFIAFAISVTVAVTGLLAPFFLCDFLTAMVSLVALQFFSALAGITVTLPTWTGFAWAMAALAVATMAVEGLAWWRGRTLAEEDVRPMYARHIAERLELQAEVSAAREAQLRLLPLESPGIPGLSISASCLPARVVGGDFYDFFRLGEHRLGIFIAEGGNRGLAAALSIALAKGYLMHTTQGGYSPTEVIERLESTLGAILEAGEARTTLAYAVIDSREGTLRYARTGAYPRILVTGAGHTNQLERQVPGADERYRLSEGSAELKPGDGIVLYTDGIARQIEARSSLPQKDWIRRLLEDNRQDAEALHRSLLNAIEARPGQGSSGVEDDLTAVIVRCGSTMAASMGVVA